MFAQQLLDLRTGQVVDFDFHDPKVSGRLIGLCHDIIGANGLDFVFLCLFDANGNELLPEHRTMIKYVENIHDHDRPNAQSKSQWATPGLFRSQALPLSRKTILTVYVSY